jgi:hypothetical protein
MVMDELRGGEEGSLDAVGRGRHRAAMRGGICSKGPDWRDARTHFSQQ